MSASIWNPGSAVQTATGNGTVTETIPLTAGQILIPITLFTYSVGAKALFVYLNGVLQVLTLDYIETNQTSITLVNPAILGDTIELVGIINLVQVATNVYDSVEQDLASAVTCNIGALRTNFIQITGTVGISSFGTNFRGPIFIRFSGVLTITNGPALQLPSGINIVTTVGMNVIVTPKASAGAADGWILTVR